MSKTAKTIAERHAIAEAHRIRMRRWRPTLADLFRIGTNTGDTRQPSATNRGPGRRHKQGHPKISRRRLIELARAAQQAAG